MQVENPIIGSMSALVTPFKNQEIDFETYQYLIKRQINNNINAVVPVGTTGESATLSHNEHKECIQIAVETCKNTKTKVIAGAGSNNTQEAIELAKFAQKCGADAVLCVTPYYNKPTQEGLFLHYQAIANAIDLPLVLYDVPGRTGVGIDTHTALRLFKEVKNIYAIKEANGIVDRATFFNSKDDKFIVFSGDDSLNLPILANGGKGVISVTGNLLPNEISKLVQLALDDSVNNAQKMIKLSNKLYDINDVLFYQSNPIPIKAAMYLSGLIPTLEYRLPLCAPSKECMDLIEKTLEKYEVVK